MTPCNAYHLVVDEEDIADIRALGVNSKTKSK